MDGKSSDNNGTHVIGERTLRYSESLTTKFKELTSNDLQKQLEAAAYFRRVLAIGIIHNIKQYKNSSTHNYI